MRTKTKYRQNNNSGQNIPVESPVEDSRADNIPEIKLDGVAAEPVTAISVEAGAEVEPSDAVAHAVEAAATADDAAVALKRQVEALRVDFPQIASLAANEALSAGVEKDSHEYWKAIEEGFDKHMAALKAQAIPKFFEPLPSPPPPAPRGPAHFVSAPVSKTVPDGSLRELNPSQVRLSAEEVEHARVSGISATEYARQKLRLAREKAAGLRQNG